MSKFKTMVKITFALAKVLDSIPNTHKVTHNNT